VYKLISCSFCKAQHLFSKLAQESHKLLCEPGGGTLPFPFESFDVDADAALERRSVLFKVKVLLARSFAAIFERVTAVPDNIASA